MASAALFVQGAILVLTLPFLAIIVYRIFLHPLAKYPGPLPAKFTDLWATYHAWRGDLTHHLERLHSVHGDFVRFGPNRISANTIEANEAIYGFKANTKKSKWYYTFAVDPQRPSTHTVIDKAQHARKRRLVAQGLSTKSTKELEPKVIESIDILSRQLAGPKDIPTTDGWSAPKDISEWASYLTVDVMGAMVFSRRFGLMETPENRWLRDAVPIASRNKYACGFTPFLIRSGLDTWIMPSLAGLRIRLRAFSIAQLQQRFARKDDESLSDIFHFILKATDPETGEKFGTAELGSEANLMIAAGGDTTSTAIAASFYFLTKECNASALQRVVAEIRGSFDRLEDIVPGPKLSACTFLRACMDESMRIAPPVPSPLMREALIGGVTIAKHTFPQGTDLAVPAFAIHRNPDYYPEPLAFRPERWLGDKEDEKLTTAQAAFCPFSIGPRSCVGRSMGYLEMTLALARLLWAMDVRRVLGNRLGEERDGTFKMLDGFVAEKYGPMVQFRRRGDVKV